MVPKPGPAQSPLSLSTHASPARQGWQWMCQAPAALSSGHKMYGLAVHQTVPRWRPRRFRAKGKPLESLQEGACFKAK